MEYLPPESDPNDGQPPILEYATPTPSPLPQHTPFYVRAIALVMSVLSLMLGLLFVCGAITAWVDWIKRWKNWNIPSDVVQFFLAGMILFTVGMLGIFGLRNNIKQGR